MIAVAANVMPRDMRAGFPGAAECCGDEVGHRSDNSAADDEAAPDELVQWQAIVDAIPQERPHAGATGGDVHYAVVNA